VRRRLFLSPVAVAPLFWAVWCVACSRRFLSLSLSLLWLLWLLVRYDSAKNSSIWYFLGLFFSPSSTCARVPQQHFCPAHRQPKSVCDRPTGRVCVCACRVCECVLCVYTAAAENLLTPLLLPSSLSLSRLNTQVRLLDYLPWCLPVCILCGSVCCSRYATHRCKFLLPGVFWLVVVVVVVVLYCCNLGSEKDNDKKNEPK
jgi:hypothetical protein